LIGKSITISGAGPYKGYVGIVKELTDTMARVELHTDCKLITVSRDRVALPGEASSYSSPSSTNAPDRRSWMAAGKTPAWNDGRTPAWNAAGGGKTTAWGSSSKTPALGASSSAKTPAWGSSSAAKTPAWGSNFSSKTPAWGAPSGKTPAWGSSSAKTPAWGSSAKTLAWGSSAKTPAWGGMASRTPGVGESGRSSDRAQPSSLPAWAIPEAEVIIQSAGGAQGKIISVLPNGKIQLVGRNEPASASELAPVAPSKKDTVRIVGEDRSTGTVIGLDGPDAVIRIDGTADFRIVPIGSLVKISRSQ